MAGLVEKLTPEHARSIGARARDRALAQHTYAQRAVQFEAAVMDEGRS